jgi:opacity protein-like surface antigen
MKHRVFAIFICLPISAAAQQIGPSIEAGYGITQSQNRTGGAAHAQASIGLNEESNFRVRAELFYQRGTMDGAGGCERLGSTYCIGTSDRNQLAALSATVHLPLGRHGRFRAYAPIGIGVYHRDTRTTETEGPIAICLDDGELKGCPDNPSLRSTAYTTKATRPGYNVGVGVVSRIRNLDVFVEMRAHDMIERNSRAGAVPFSIGIKF